MEPILTFGTEGDFPITLEAENILADLLASDIPFPDSRPADTRGTCLPALCTTSANLTLKAKAWKTGWSASSVKGAAYSIILLSSQKKLPNKAVVTAAPATSRFYIEADDRSCGILVYKSGYIATVGARLTVTGILGTSSSGEKWMVASSVTDAGTGTIEPIMLSNRDVGGDWYYNASTGAGQKGVREYHLADGQLMPEVFQVGGLNNIGLLICTYGKATRVGSGYFYVNDGYAAADNLGQVGVKVMGSVPQPDLLPPDWNPVRHYVKVTGISFCFKAALPSTDLFRQIVATHVDLVQ